MQNKSMKPERMANYILLKAVCIRFDREFVDRSSTFYDDLPSLPWYTSPSLISIPLFLYEISFFYDTFPVVPNTSTTFLVSTPLQSYFSASRPSLILPSSPVSSPPSQSSNHTLVCLLITIYWIIYSVHSKFWLMSLMSLHVDGGVGQETTTLTSGNEPNTTFAISFHCQLFNPHPVPFYYSSWIIPHTVLELTTTKKEQVGATPQTQSCMEHQTLGFR